MPSLNVAHTGGEYSVTVRATTQSDAPAKTSNSNSSESSNPVTSSSVLPSQGTQSAEQHL